MNSCVEYDFSGLNVSESIYKEASISDEVNQERVNKQFLEPVALGGEESIYLLLE
jgi:hypothetical protein